MPDARSLVLQPDLAELSRARHFVTSMAEQAGFANARVFDIALLTSEAAANAIEHAPYKGQVTITALVYEDRLEVQVSGPGEFQTPDRSRERTTRGLGLPLMAKLSDHLALYSAPEGGTLLTLTFYREGHSPRRTGLPLPPTLLELFETGDRLEAVFGAMPEGFAIFDPDLRCVYLNDAMAEHDGRPKEVLLGAGLSSLEHETAILPEIFAKAKASGREISAEAKHPHREMWSEVSVIPFAGGYAMFSRDISGRKLADDERRDSEQRLADGQELVETLLGNRALATCIVRGEDLVYVFANQAYRELRPGGDPTGKRVADLFPDMSPEIGETIRGVLETGVSTEFEVTSADLAGRCDGDGEGRRFRILLDRVRIPGDDEWSVLSTSVEIPGPRVEDGFAERFRAFADNLPGISWIKDAEGRYVYLSKAYEQRFGVRAADRLGKTDADVWPAEAAEESRKNDLAVLESGEALRVVEKTVDEAGETGYWLNSKFTFSNAAGERFVGGVGIDITSRVEAEEALREREERFRFLAEENERLYRQQLDIAERLQLALLNIPSEIGRVRVGHLYRSATEAARVGGDFYDVFEVKGGLVVVLVGDVAGHGIEAARTATLVKDVVHAFTHQSVRPQEVLRRTNGLLVEKELPGFVTLFLGILDSETGEFRYASAGHPSTFLRRADGDVKALGTGSAPLGVHEDATWKSGSVDLEAGDLLLLYTDGVIEARRGGEFFGEKRLETLLRRKRISVERLPHTVLDQVLAFSGGGLRDDVAVLALSFAGPAPGARGGPGFVQESLLT